MDPKSKANELSNKHLQEAQSSYANKQANGPFIFVLNAWLSGSIRRLLDSTNTIKAAKAACIYIYNIYMQNIDTGSWRMNLNILSKSQFEGMISYPPV